MTSVSLSVYGPSLSTWRLRGQRVRTDTILPIRPERLVPIIAGEANHAFCNKLDDQTTWLWFYDTSQDPAIKYVALTGLPKRPGEINDPSGVGNEDFDADLNRRKWAYPIRKLFKFEIPISQTELARTFDIDMRAKPQRAKRRMVEDLWMYLELVYDAESVPQTQSV